jgi:hypothetical protein
VDELDWHGSRWQQRKEKIDRGKRVGDSELCSQGDTPVTTSLARGKVRAPEHRQKTKLGGGVRRDDPIGGIRHSPATAAWNRRDVARADGAHESTDLAFSLSRSQFDRAGMRGKDGILVEEAEVLGIAQVGELSYSRGGEGMAEC